MKIFTSQQNTKLNFNIIIHTTVVCKFYGIFLKYKCKIMWS